MASSLKPKRSWAQSVSYKLTAILLVISPLPHALSHRKYASKTLGSQSMAKSPPKCGAARPAAVERSAPTSLATSNIKTIGPQLAGILLRLVVLPLKISTRKSHSFWWYALGLLFYGLLIQKAGASMVSCQFAIKLG